MDEETRVTQVRAELQEDVFPEDACLVLIYPPGPSLGKRFELNSAAITIGRGHDCDIMLDRDAVSRKHARIERLPAETGGGGRRFGRDLAHHRVADRLAMPQARQPLR